jgi:ribosomal protein S18 acetylase RimI-like enzyme
VASESRGRGAGGRLLAAADGRATARGAARLSVVTQGHNVEALRIYEKHGFRIEGLNLFYHVWLDRVP